VSDLTKEEQASVAVALRFLKARAGGWAPLAKVLHFDIGTMSRAANGRRGTTVTMALRIARLAQVGVDDVLAGRYPGPGICAHCGARKEEQAPPLTA
jgi:hypothetical protein